MNFGYTEFCLACKQIDEVLYKEVEEYGYVLCNFSTKAFMFNATEDHEVWVYQLGNRKYWIRKFEGKLMEFREIT